MYKTPVVILLFLVFSAFVSGEKKLGEEENKKNTGSSSENLKPEEYYADTVPAVVMYGNRFLFENIELFDKETIREYRDSLAKRLSPEDELLKQINLYLRIQSMTRKEIYHIIDSLFELEKIPFPLINQINYYAATHPIEEFHKEPEIIPTDTSYYPANNYYLGQWNTQIPHPYKPELYANDTTVEIILVGRGKSDAFVMPVENTLTSEFGWRDGRPHKGIDIDLEVWDPVKAAFPGRVRVARYYGGYGRVVVIRHYNGLETLYAHLHRFKVKPGDEVKAGDVIGLGGSSGHSTGSHLHFEVRYKGVPINPLSFISHEESKLVCDTLILKKTKHGFASYPKGTKFYVVKKGDSLYEIAKKFGTTTSHLAKINGIRRNSILVVGQTLRVI
ncbi:MAG: LysM peptidoglycan-binding domain-containing protein [Bacteroidetes bacterium]|nr:MAG: LysM peptidoglycan-binding domain-containing protein [Bacteroidota bacterium]